MKKIITVLFAATMLFTLSACSSINTNSQLNSSSTQEDASVSDNESGTSLLGFSDLPLFSGGEDTQESEDAPDGENILIVYFSKTGNTETIANMIEAQTGGELFKIETNTTYPDNYDETVEIAREEQDNDARPELSSHIEDMSQYDIIFLGYPIWWGTMPQAMFTFLEEYDFSGKQLSRSAPTVAVLWVAAKVILPLLFRTLYLLAV